MLIGVFGSRETVAQFRERVRATTGRQAGRLRPYATRRVTYPIACSIDPELYRDAAAREQADEFFDVEALEEELDGMSRTASADILRERIAHIRPDQPSDPLQPSLYEEISDTHRARARQHGGLAVMRPWQWYALVRAFGGKCAYCGQDRKLTLDHVEPLSRGGDHALWNTVPACRPCNSSKNDRDLESWHAYSPLVEERIVAGRKRLVEDIGEEWMSPGRYCR